MSYKYFEVHSSIVNVNAGQVLRFWRNSKDRRVYVCLPGGLLPGPYRVVSKTKRHVTTAAVRVRKRFISFLPDPENPWYCGFLGVLQA